MIQSFFRSSNVTSWRSSASSAALQLPFPTPTCWHELGIVGLVSNVIQFPRSNTSPKIQSRHVAGFFCRLDTRFETMGEFHQDLTPEISSVIGEHFYYFSGFEGASETCPNLLLKRGRSCAYRPSNGNYFQCPNVQPDSDLPSLWGGFSTVSIISDPILQGLMKLSIGDGMWWPCMSLGICIRSDSPLRSAFEWQVRWFGLVKRVTPCGSCVREVYI